MTKIFWLSFSAGADTPLLGPGRSRHLGVVCVEVSEHEARRIKPRMLARHPHAKEGGEWLYAALDKCHVLRINPGGAVASWELNPDDPKTKLVPRYRLMQKAELVLLGALRESDDPNGDTIH